MFRLKSPSAAALTGKNFLGGRVGYCQGDLYYDVDGGLYMFHGIPVLADYVHYCPIGKSRKHSIYLGGEIGPIFQYYPDGCGAEDSWMEHQDDPDWLPSPIYSGTMYMCFKFGLDFRIGNVPHLMVGLQANLIGASISAGITF